MNTWPDLDRHQKRLALLLYSTEELELAAQHMTHEELVLLYESGRFTDSGMRALAIKVGAL